MWFPSDAASAVEQRRIVPWTAEQVSAVTAAHPERWRAAAVVAAGCGLRQGEVFGLRVKDVDFLRQRLLVRQQVKLLGGKPILAPPKGRKTPEVPLPDVVAVALSEHLRQFAAADGLVFTSRERRLTNRNYYNRHVWKPGLGAGGMEQTRENGMHALRHFYASVQRKPAPASAPSRSTSGTPTPASRCASTRTSFPPVRTAPGRRWMPPSSPALGARVDLWANPAPADPPAAVTASRVQAPERASPDRPRPPLARTSCVTCVSREAL